MYVESNLGRRRHCPNTTGLSTQNLSPIALTVTKLLGAKRNWLITWDQHMQKTKFFIVTSNLETFSVVTIYSTSNSNLRVHAKRVHEKAGNKAANAPLLCGSCDYRTDLKTNLVRHKKGCTKSVEPNENLCNLCHKTFSTKKILHKHTKLHSKEKTFTPNSTVSCVVCKKTFDFWYNRTQKNG